MLISERHFQHRTTSMVSYCPSVLLSIVSNHHTGIRISSICIAVKPQPGPRSLPSVRSSPWQSVSFKVFVILQMQTYLLSPQLVELLLLRAHFLSNPSFSLYGLPETSHMAVYLCTCTKELSKYLNVPSATLWRYVAALRQVRNF